MPIPEPNNIRSKWDHGGKTQLVSALGKAQIQQGTFGMPDNKGGSTENIVNKSVEKGKKGNKAPVYIYCIYKTLFY